MKSINAIITIASRDVIKFARDRSRIIASLIFPFIFVGILGTSLDRNISSDVVPEGFFLAFTFTGVIGQILFQSTASGIISLVEDRENDFAQEMFIAPISRYVVIIGKIIGESIVAAAQLLGILVFGVLIGVPMILLQITSILPALIPIMLLGGAFGTLVMANLSSQKAANQIFPFLLLPQFFLAGVFAPVGDLPLPLMVLSRISPMTYAVDLVRGVFFAGDEFANSGGFILNSSLFNLAIIAAMSFVFIVVGTYIFIRNERQR